MKIFSVLTSLVRKVGSLVVGSVIEILRQVVSELNHGACPSCGITYCLYCCKQSSKMTEYLLKKVGSFLFIGPNTVFTGGLFGTKIARVCLRRLGDMPPNLLSPPVAHTTHEPQNTVLFMNFDLLQYKQNDSSNSVQTFKVVLTPL